MDTRTERLRLERPEPGDLEALHRLYSDPRVWKHFPSARHTELSQSRELLQKWIEDWRETGLGIWFVRLPHQPGLLGHGGVSLRFRHEAGAYWNLGYRFTPEAQGHGYATEVSSLAIEKAHKVRPELPVVAYLLEHNISSKKVAERVGLKLHYRASDAGNPDPDAIRLVYADRPLTQEQMASCLA